MKKVFNQSNLKKAAYIIKDGVVALAIFLVIFFAASRILPNFSYGLYLIQSGSMQPALKIGSVVVDKKIDKYKKGDIITYKQLGKIITHRIDSTVEKNGEVFYRTKGDANNGLDSFLVKKSDVFGKVLFPVPYVGYLMSFVRTKLGIFLLIIIPSVWFIILEAKYIKKEFDKKGWKIRINNNDDNK